MENENTQISQNAVPQGTPPVSPVPSQPEIAPQQPQQSQATVSPQVQISPEQVSQSVQQPAQQQPTPAMQIQQLLVQQQQYQQQYNQIVTFLKQNPNQTPDQIQTYKVQLNQLNASYLQTQSQLKALGYNPVQVNKPTTVKEGAKSNFSFKKLAIGCGFLLVLLILGFGGGLYYLTQNPNALNSVGITATTAKSLLTIFAGLFFGVFLLVGLGFLLTNIYRLITVKNQSRVRYALGLVGALLMLGVAGGAMALVFQQIGKIETTEVQQSTNLIDAYLIGKGQPAIWGSVKTIAPGEVSFVLNQGVWNTYIASLGEVTPQSLILHCGNTQKQTVVYRNGIFDGTCFYDKKGSYPISIIVRYDNNITGEKGISVEKNIGSLTFESEVQLYLTATKTTQSSSSKQSTPISATGGEFILGKAPAKITVDTTSIFRDFSLGEYNVFRDMDEDDVYDRENMVTFDFIYKLPKVYYPTVKFPDLQDFIYRFPVRVEQSDVPICEISLTPFEQGKTKYKIQANFLDGLSSNISRYGFSIIDTATNKVIDTVNQTSKELDYTFPEKGSYLVVVNFATIDGKNGSCESDTLQLAKQTIDVEYVLRQKSSTATAFSVIPSSQITDGTILLTSIPQTIQIDISSIIPTSNATQRNVFVDGAVILNQGTQYEFKVNEERDYQVEIVVENTELGAKTTIPLTFTIKRPEITAVLKTNQDRGYEPLTVVLDASQSVLNVEGDEIIYFTWDFGDGEIKQNLTNGVVSHTYTYDYTTESGTYAPSVTITTRKGYTAKATLDLPILVSKQLIQVDISATSHPTQIAKTNDTVSFLAEFNGLPETMKRNFGDGSTPVQCKGRACTETSHVYSTAGTYKVILTLEFEDMQTTDAIMEIRVN